MNTIKQRSLFLLSSIQPHQRHKLPSLTLYLPEVQGCGCCPWMQPLGSFQPQTGHTSSLRLYCSRSTLHQTAKFENKPFGKAWNLLKTNQEQPQGSPCCGFLPREAKFGVPTTRALWKEAGAGAGLPRQV